jgi:hypothetical protein
MERPTIFSAASAGTTFRPNTTYTTLRDVTPGRTAPFAWWRHCRSCLGGAACRTFVGVEPQVPTFDDLGLPAGRGEMALTLGGTRAPGSRLGFEIAVRGGAAVVNRRFVWSLSNGQQLVARDEAALKPSMRGSPSDFPWGYPRLRRETTGCD